MNSNRPAVRSSASSSTFVDATSCSAPKSTPSLSSSCTPFYPRSHSQCGFDGTFQDPAPKDDNLPEYSKEAYAWSYAKAPSFHNQHYYPGLGSDVAWMPDNENVWGCLGAWQWGDSAHAGYAYGEGEAENPSFDASHCLSYYPDSPTQEDQSYSCSLSNIPSEQCAKTSSYLYCWSDVMPEPGKHGDNMGTQVESTNASAGSKPTEKFTFSQYSPQSPSIAVAKDVELAKEKGTNEWLGGSCSLSQSDKLTKSMHSTCNKKGFADTHELKHAMRLPSGHTESQEALNTDVAGRQLIEGEGGLKSSLSLGSSQAPVKTGPIEERKYGSTSAKAYLLNGLNTKQYVATSDADLPHNHYDELGLSYGLAEDTGLVSSGSQWMIQSIHNLCKVLVSIQSGTCSRALGQNETFAIERAISMLSELLLYSCVNQLGSSQTPNNLQDAKKVNDAPGGSGALCNEHLTLDNNTKTGSVWSASERELAEAVKLTESTLVADEQGSGKRFPTRNVEKQLLDLQDKVMELQEVVAYERSESNITVSTYKQLWSEAQEALKFSRSETTALRIELTHLKEELRSLKSNEASGVHEGKADGIKLCRSCSNQENGSNPHQHPCAILESSSSPPHHSYTNQESSSSPRHHFCTPSFQESSSSPRHHFCTDQKASNGERSAESFKSSMASLPESIDVLMGYFDPENTLQRSTTCIQRSEIFREDEQVTSRERHLPTLTETDDGLKDSPVEPLIKSKTGPLENEVAQRLSLLLSRREAAGNDTCADGSMDVMVHSGTLQASDVEDEALVQGKKLDHVVGSVGAFHMAAVNKEAGFLRFNPGWQVKPDTDSKVGLVKNDTSVVGMSSLCQEEDEVEIICLRSGAAESSSASATGELEWEHVIVSRDLW